MYSIDVRAFYLTRRYNRVFYGKPQLPATVGLKRHHEQCRWLQGLFEESSEYELKVATFTLTRGQNFIEMFSLMLASFYIFNVEYPKKLEGSLMFLQKFLLGMGDEIKTPQKVLQLMSKVTKAAI